MNTSGAGVPSERVLGGEGVLGRLLDARLGLEVIEELGRGADTVVYRVRRNGGEYALKLLRYTSGADGRTLASFQREAALLACVNHPDLPRVVEVDQVHGRPYLVLELVEGRPLSDLLHAGALDQARVLRLGIDVAGALAAAHRAGVVHRDIKPSNILIGPDGTARLIDFGLATYGGRGDDETVVGTLAYSAPEQTGMLKRPVDGRSDLYGLGVVLFECATGSAPFTSADVGELIRMHATASPPDARAMRPDLASGIAAVIGKLLAKDPDDRYQTGEGLVADLERLLQSPHAAFALGTREDVTGAVADIPLVGRRPEYAELMTLWRRAREGHGGIAVVKGPPGVGKSRLARELVAAARTDGGLVLRGECSPDDPVPLAPVRSAVDRHLHMVGQLQEPERSAALERLRVAAGGAASLLKTLSPALAAVLPSPDIAGDDRDDRHEQFASGVAAFLVELARAEGGTVLHIDDVQWLDDATRRILTYLARILADVPMLLVITARDDAESAAVLERFIAEVGDMIDSQLTLAPLDEEAVAGLVAAQLGGGAVDHQVISALARRADGNPFAVQEYVRAALDAGLLRPSWGTWLVDMDGMDHLELSGGVLDLVLRRVESLGGTARAVLTAAAGIGMRFRAGLLNEVCVVDRGQLLDVLGDAAARRLVELREGGEYAFLHDRIRAALLVDLGPVEVRRLHQHIAETLDRLRDPEVTDVEANQVYATARHYTLGETDRDPARVYVACTAAGTLALADYAPVEALAFLEQAASMAAVAGIAPDSAFHQSFGVALARNGRFTDALRSLARALEGEQNRRRCAAIHGLIAHVYMSAWDHDESLISTAQALRELGAPLPRNRLLMALTTVLSFLAGLAVSVTRIGFGTAAGESRERFRLQASLYDTGAYAAAVGMRVPLQVSFVFRSLYSVSRLGPCPEYVRRLAGFGVVASMARRHRLAERLYDHAAGVANRLGDPTLVANVEWKRGAGRYFGGVDRGETWVSVLEEQGRWLDIGDYFTATATWCCQLALRGHTREAETWYQRGQARLSSGAEAEGSPLTAVGVLLPAQAGRPSEAAGRLRSVREFVQANPGSLSQRLNMIGALMYIAVEQGDYGTAFTEALDEFERLRLNRVRIHGEQRVIFVHRAFGWLARLAQVTPADQHAVRVATERAVTDLGRAAGSDLLRAYHMVARAGLAQLSDAPDQALALLARADRLAERLDAPAVIYEAARVRARALRALGLGAAASRQASIALLQANQQGWPHRARWAREEFALADMVGSDGRSPDSGGSNALHRRRLQALQEVSLAAATVLDPRELAKVALDETVRILGAERAYLFLLDPERNQLVPHLGRYADGREVDELTGYSATLVERVRRTREALVVTGTDEAAALGSRSAVMYGLRSIMIAPLQLDERLLGVVYLDSRVAKGIFTADDVDILVAITHHVAVSLETARAAQLEVAVQAARGQRDVAEMLRAAMAELSATLDPGQVMARLLEKVVKALPGDVAVVLRPSGTRLDLIAAYGDVPDGVMEESVVDPPVDPAADPVLAGLLELTGPKVGVVASGQPAPAGRVLGAVRCWLATPVSARGMRLGVLLVGSRQVDQVSEAQVEVVATLAGQGMVAYENARLFSEVQRLATTDSLTSLNNRSHFLELAGRQMEQAQQRRWRVTAIMIDIDYFKQINDSHGHTVGDDVIHAVAERVRGACRSSDALCRYGGDEFALLTFEAGAEPVAVGERLRAAVTGEPVGTAAGALSVTISVGVAQADRGDYDLADLLLRADEALYDAKRAGRDRVAAR